MQRWVTAEDFITKFLFDLPDVLVALTVTAAPTPAHSMTDLILYTTEDGHSQIKLRAQEQTVWPTQS